MKNNFYTLIAFSLFSSITYADSEVKQAIKTNGQVIYQQQKSVNSFNKMFSEGNFYGRLRTNNFYYTYDHEDSSHEDNLAFSLGASFVYKSASYNNIDLSVALYGSEAFFDENSLNDISHLKSAKDTMSRFNYINTGSKSLVTFAQANLNYKVSKTNLTFGRQLVETFYTKSNDTKMIPNSFDGIVATSKEFPSTTIKLAYLAKQKLRDHEDSHAVFMVGDEASSSSINPKWSENDDSAMHKGLTFSALKQADKPTDAPLIVIDAQNNSIKNLKINFSSYVVPQLLSQTMGELNYKIQFNGFSMTPAIRYIQQFDNGAGDIGGASITTKGLSGYNNPNSLNAKMLATRVVTKIDNYKINLAYTQIFDKADLVTPWRGFPTSGYTRSMGIYNWRANTKSYRLELVKGANKNGVYKNPFIQTSILYVDADQTKDDLDSMLYYVGIVQNIPSLPQVQYRIRLGYRDFIGDSASTSNYLDSRLEFNYLF